MKRLRTQDYEASGRVLRLLEYSYPSFNVALQNYPNIEDFLNLLEIAKTFNSEEYIRSSIWSPNELEKVS